LRAEIGNSRTSISIRELFSLKELFGVSAQAIAFRSADLDIINESLKRQIFIEFGKRGWRKAEPRPNFEGEWAPWSCALAQRC
jgi:hypothetical protein